MVFTFYQYVVFWYSALCISHIYINNQFLCQHIKIKLH